MKVFSGIYHILEQIQAKVLLMIKPKKKVVKNISESSRVFVKNIEKDADVDEVRKVFEAHGIVKDVYNPGKGFAFVR